MRVVRTQWPIGQGCFASGIIGADGAAPIHYVYDCGARNLRHLGPIVSRYADRVDKLDALFVSHLDGDHVDGLDLLLATLSPTEVYLPYLDIADRVLSIMKQDAAARLTASFVQAQLDPVAWFRSRGADRVIFVRNGGDVPEGGFRPPEGRGEGPGAEPERRLHLECFGTEPYSDHLSMQENAQTSQVMEMKVGGSVSAMSGSATHWLLVPFVPEVDPTVSAAFHSKVRDALGLGPADTITTEVVQNKLKTKDGRTDLRDCYDEILSEGARRNHNKVSMSLYSGPADGRKRWVRRLRHWGWDDGYYLYRETEQPKPGWIATGDAKLGNKKRRTEWKQFYRHLAPMVGTFLLPHHGSKENWHPDLLDSTAAHLFVATADKPSEGYKHPSPTVVLDIDDADRTIALVTKRLRSRLVEWIEDEQV